MGPRQPTLCQASRRGLRRGPRGWGRFTASALLLHAACVLLVALLYCTSSSSAAAASPCQFQCNCTLKSQWYSVNCTGRALKRIPSKLPSKTTVLDLSRNHIVAMDRNSFVGFDSLISISLAHNQLTEIDSDTFTHLGHLMMVLLSHNHIQQLEATTFENTNVKLLDLSSNNLFFPSSEPFLISQTLVVLRINSNQIRLESLPEIALSQLPNLEELDISNNMIKRVPVESLQNLQNLTKLNVAMNPLICDCELKKTRKWTEKSKVNVKPQVFCAEPASMSGSPWEHLDNEQCDSNLHSLIFTSILCISGVLVVIAILVAVMVCQRRKRKDLQKKKGIPLPAVPSPEYVEMQAALHDYESLRKKSPGMEEKVREKEAEVHFAAARRAVPSGDYVPPFEGDKGPIYVNLLGPPLPLRRPSSEISTTSSNQPPGSPSHRPANRRCSVPLLEGCDYYEEVD